MKAVKYLKPAFRLTKSCLIYSWGTKSAYVKTKQKISAARGSEHDNRMNEKRQPRTKYWAAKKNKNKKNRKIRIILTQRLLGGSKGGWGLDRTSAFRGVLLGKRGVTFFGGLQFSHKK